MCIRDRIRVVLWALFKPGHDLYGGISLSVLQQPSRTLGESKNADYQDDAEEGLESNGKPPLERVGGIEPEAIIDPVTESGKCVVRLETMKIIT